MTQRVHEESDPLFTIRIEPVRKFVAIVMRGFWNKDDLDRFDRTLRRILPNLRSGGCAIGDQVTFFDLSSYQVQSQDVLTGLAAMATDPSIGSRKIAVVLSSGLLKLQARRVAPVYGLFDDRDEAMAWLEVDDR
ncbi:MAG: hypothetical protein ACK4TC_03835 [Sphingomonas pseudosanguinis]|uniref:hypothetical protein n=1 Tax=Sphingomonas pseudosanguinis TaxID=413712 RepID=UPI003919CAC2